jgi:hypothetical protein
MIVNETAGDVSPTPFVAVTTSGPTGGVVDEPKVNVLLGPDPSWVNPAIVGKLYAFMPDWPSLETAVSVKLPLLLGRK